MLISSLTLALSIALHMDRHNQPTPDISSIMGMEKHHRTACERTWLAWGRLDIFPSLNHVFSGFLVYVSRLERKLTKAQSQKTTSPKIPREIRPFIIVFWIGSLELHRFQSVSIGRCALQAKPVDCSDKVGGRKILYGYLKSRTLDMNMNTRR